MVSIVIPVYKVEEYLCQCVDTAINQTYTDLEIILVDDGSPDNCGIICDEYADKDSRIRVVHKENGGLSDARNAGLAVAHGEYIYFLDSDDYISLDAIKQLVNIAEREQADIVFFKGTEFTEDPDIPVYEIEIRKEYPTAPGAEILIERHNNREMRHSVWLHFYKRAFLAQENLQFKKGLLYEDILFSGVAYVRAQRVCALNKALYFYRKRKGSIMNVKPTTKNLNSFYTNIIELAKEKKRYACSSPEQEALDIMIVYAAWAYMETYSDVSKEDRKAEKNTLKSIRKELKPITIRGCRKHRIKYFFPRLWLLYHFVKKRIKNEK